MKKNPKRIGVQNNKIFKNVIMDLNKIVVRLSNIDICTDDEINMSCKNVTSDLCVDEHTKTDLDIGTNVYFNNGILNMNTLSYYYFKHEGIDYITKIDNFNTDDIDFTIDKEQCVLDLSSLRVLKNCTIA